MTNEELKAALVSGCSPRRTNSPQRGTATMNNKIILSIHHKYSELILTEKKTLEIRKSAPRRGACGDGVNGKCKNVTHCNKVNCLTLKQDRWANSGLIEYKGFCRYLTTRELELAQTLPIGYTRMLTRTQAENVLGDCWTVDVIAHIFSGLKEANNEL